MGCFSDLMCQASKAHLGWRRGWLSTTEAFAQSMSYGWCLVHVQQLQRRWWCQKSVPSCVSWDDVPRYVQFGQCAPLGMMHNVPGTRLLASAWGIGSFGWTSSCLSVWCGLKQVRISSAVRILRIVSDMCRTYGRTTVALDLFTVSGLLVGLDWLLMNLAGYPLLFRAWVTCFSSVPFSSGEEHMLSALKNKVHTTAALWASGWWDWKSRYLSVWVAFR